MPRSKVLVVGVTAILAVLLGLVSEGNAQLAPADRPPPPPPPPPLVRFAHSGTPRSQSIPENVRYQLIPVARQQQAARSITVSPQQQIVRLRNVAPQQQAARPVPRGQPRSISTHPAVSQAGYGQLRGPDQPQTNLAQPLRAQAVFAPPQTTIQPLCYVQLPSTVAPQSVYLQPQRTVRPQVRYTQPSRTTVPQAVSPQTVQARISQPQRLTTTQSGADQPQRIPSGSIITHPAESQAGYGTSQSSSNRQVALTLPQRTQISRARLVSSQRPIYAGQAQTQRTGQQQG